MRKVLSWGCRVAVTVCLCAPWMDLCAQPTLEEVLSVLESRGISFDRDAARQAAVDAVLRSVDPGAKIVQQQVPDLAPAQDEGTDPVAESWPAGIQYLRLEDLGTSTTAAAVERLGRWAGARRRGVILDLRKANGHCPFLVDSLAGGLAGASNTLYEVRDSTNGVVEVHRAGEGAADRVSATLPWVVLTSSRTAGDAELLAAVLKGMPGVMLVGTHTHGDAAVREALELEGGHVLLVATSWRVPASGAGYDRRGVVPDILIKEDASSPGPSGKVPNLDSSGRTLTAKAEEGKGLMEKVKGDACMQRAVDILLALKALPGPAAKDGKTESDDAASD